jgi:MFS family permease
MSTNRRTSYGSVLADREYRVIFAAGGLSWIGDYLARAAITLFVYTQTGSVGDSAVTFAISYLPWLVGGPVLAALAERYPARRVMIACDLARAVLVGAVVIPGVPIWGIWLLLFSAALLNSPFDASRSALLTRIFTDDRYVLASSMQQTAQQFAVLVGYGPGPALAAFNPRIGVLVDALTFAASALLLASRVQLRPATTSPKRERLLVETARGFGHILRSNVLRPVALLVLLLLLVTTVPEGLAAAWAAKLPHPVGGRGLAQALIMGSNPIGQLLGGVLINRLVPADRRQRIIPVLAFIAPAALVPALLHPNALVIGACALVSGFALQGVLPNSIGLFARVVAPQFRTRVFGVMQTGVVASQALGVLVAGALASRYDLPTVVGLWSAGGAVAVLLACFAWPSRARVTAAAEANGTAAAEANGTAAAPVPSQPPAATAGHPATNHQSADHQAATAHAEPA